MRRRTRRPEYSRPRHLLQRLDAEHDVDPAQLHVRTLSQRPGQRQRGTGPQPDGPSLPHRGNGAVRRDSGTGTTRGGGPTASTFRASATSTRRAAQKRLPARLRLPGRRRVATAGAPAPIKAQTSARDFKDGLDRTPARGRSASTGFGECLPVPRQPHDLNDAKRDKWGLPHARRSTPAGRKTNWRSTAQGHAVTRRRDARGAPASERDDRSTTAARHGLGIHEMGTARMGRDPKTSVLNAHNQVHAVPTSSSPTVPA